MIPPALCSQINTLSVNIESPYIDSFKECIRLFLVDKWLHKMVFFSGLALCIRKGRGMIYSKSREDTSVKPCISSKNHLIPLVTERDHLRSRLLSPRAQSSPETWEERKARRGHLTHTARLPNRKVLAAATDPVVQRPLVQAAATTGSLRVFLWSLEAPFQLPTGSFY